MPESIESFLSAVHRTFAEVTRRAPDYFTTRPLRVSAPPVGAVAAVADAFGARLLTTTAQEFTAVDELVDRRRCDPTESIPGGEQAGGWARWRLDQDRRTALRAAQAAHLARAMDRRTARHEGRSVHYRVCGQGPLLVLVTALGHTDEVWYPLAERLLHGRRVAMWDAGERDPSGRPWTLAGHLADVDAVLHAEGVRSCDVIGWCSGAQVALEYAYRRPGVVRAAVLLNGSYPRAGTDAASRYERDLAAVCASVVARPERASRALRMLAGAGAVVPLPADERLAAVEVLARTPPGLASVLRRPFRDANALVNYSHQLSELWRRELPGPGASVPPLLSLAAGLDRIAAPEPPRALLPLLSGRHGELVGATHYSMLDRPEVVAAVCAAFFDDPTHDPTHDPAREAAREAAGGPIAPPREIVWGAPVAEVSPTAVQKSINEGATP
ncbi:alpha/beta fold hydrolase [Streptomyces sp. NPDC056500]|uniref:alpha/beta fold hydrolase n=1 Tax=Streptomyces sp. NPDC056500 TaxID=3345840 RepID=UPI0036C63301